MKEKVKLDNVFVKGKGCISAKIIADSISFNTNKRITTFEIEYPRFVHCFDDETEVLCENKDGEFKFLKFDDAILNDVKVAQVEKENFEISFVKPKRWIKNRFNGNLINYESQRLNFSVTDEHRLLVGSRKSWGNQKDVILAKDLLVNHTQKRFYKSGQINNQTDFGDDFCKFVAFFISDGHLPKEGRQAIMRFKRERKIKEVKRLLRNIGITHEIRKYKDDVTAFVFYRENWMEECYTSTYKKIFPSRFFYMSESNFENFKQGLLESDGCVNNNEFNTYSEELIDSLQALFHCHGKSFNKNCYNGCYKVKFLVEDFPIIRKDKQRPILTPYNGFVYCCTVPTGFIIVRRNGIVHISGNCEFMTHRLFSRNCASSRAIPVKEILKQIRNNPAMPIFWGKNQPGMQAIEEHCVNIIYETDYGEVQELTREDLWKNIAKSVSRFAETFSAAGYHKQIVNRILEPFQIMKTVITATEFDNFFYLRCHKDAQPEIQELAKCMYECYKISKPEILYRGDWHTPYVKHSRVDEYFLYYGDNQELSFEQARIISASCCAQTSYRKNDESYEKALKIYDKLITSIPPHSGPFEHQATPIFEQRKGWNDGVTHVDRNGNYWSGNFQGWIQFRQLIPNNACWNYEETLDNNNT